MMAMDQLPVELDSQKGKEQHGHQVVPDEKGQRLSGREKYPNDNNQENQECLQYNRALLLQVFQQLLLPLGKIESFKKG